MIAMGALKQEITMIYMKYESLGMLLIRVYLQVPQKSLNMFL
jgi:hypothetical protein